MAPQQFPHIILSIHRPKQVSVQVCTTAFNRYTEQEQIQDFVVTVNRVTVTFNRVTVTIPLASCYQWSHVVPIKLRSLLPPIFRQATGLDAWASRVKCPARFVSHLHEICIYIYIWVVYSLCFFCCLFITVTWWYPLRLKSAFAVRARISDMECVGVHLECIALLFC